MNNGRPLRRPRIEEAPLTPYGEAELAFEQWYREMRPILKETYIAAAMAKKPRLKARPPEEFADDYEELPAPEIRDRRVRRPRSEGEMWELPNNQLPHQWRKVYHRNGEEPCDRAALIVTQPLPRGVPMKPLEVLRKINGDLWQASDIVTCGFCGYELHEATTNADLDWRPHLIAAPSNPRTGEFVEPESRQPHPQDVLQDMVTSLGTLPPDAPDEVYDRPQTLQLESEAEALLELGRQYMGYPEKSVSQEMNDAPEDEAHEQPENTPDPVDGRSNRRTKKRRRAS